MKKIKDKEKTIRLMKKKTVKNLKHSKKRKKLMERERSKAVKVKGILRRMFVR